jgi:hypothetical protein
MHGKMIYTHQNRYSIGNTLTIKGLAPNKLHIRGHVDDMIITKFWNQHKKRWIYEVHNPYALDVWFETNRMKIGKSNIPIKKSIGKNEYRII